MVASGINTFYASGLTSPNAYDATDFNSGTSLAGIPDVTALIQAAINACQAFPDGGVVQLPPGVFRVNGLMITGDSVTLRGDGAGVSPGIGGGRAPYGTWFL